VRKVLYTETRPIINLLDFVFVKTPPQSVLGLKLSLASTAVKLCKAVVVDAGHSLPCMVPFSDIYADGRNLSWTMNSWAHYFNDTLDGTHGSTVIYFPRVTNVGERNTFLKISKEES
jgi:hypothetical protein